MMQDQLAVHCASEAEAHDLSDMGVPAVVVGARPAPRTSTVGGAGRHDRATAGTGRR